MNHHNQTGPEDLCLEAQERIDAVCVRYERLCKAGELPPPEHFVEEVPFAEMELLRQELLRIEAHYRQLGGSSFDTKSQLEKTGTGPYKPSPAVAGMTSLGPFQLRRVLGQGGMGTVYEAEDPGLDRLIALKLMNPDFATCEDARQRFLREAQAMAALKNDNVVRVYQVGEVGDILFVKMELLAGESLDARLRRLISLPWHEVVRIGLETASGLAAAHGRGLIHRDIKPSNLWLEAMDRNSMGPAVERVKILDFGLAKSVQADNRMATGGMILGTPAYMAPEQARCEQVDARADLFSLGCVLYHMAAGSKPFDGSSPTAILSKVLTAEPAPLAEVCPGLPPALTRLIEQLLSKDPDLRPASAREVAAKLQAIADGELITPHVPSKAVNNSATYTGTVLAAVFVAALVVGLGVWSLAQGGKSGNPQVPGREEPLRGDLIVRVRSQDGKNKPEARIGFDPLALPIREDEVVQMEAKLNQAAYIYLLWVDGKGEVTPLYPWNADGKLVHKTLAAAPPPQVPTAEVRNPNYLVKWWPADDTEGLDTILLLARRTPLPDTVSLVDLVGKLPEARLGPLHEVVIRGMDRGVLVEEVKVDQDRRVKEDARVLEDQLLSLMDRLQGHFELIRAVQFAHAGK